MSSSQDDRHAAEQEERVVIRDNRKIDRHAAAAAGDSPVAAPAGEADHQTDSDLGAEPVGEAVDAAATVDAALLDERTADLQRVQAEYANYRRRAERERLLAGDAAVGRVLADLLPVVDDLERAKAHGDLTGPLKAVADKLEGVTGKLGLVAFGEVGDPFDPSRHEAVLHDESDAVTEPTCTTIMRPGYLLNDRLLRPAMVGVSDPSSPGPSAAEDQDAATGSGPADADPSAPSAGDEN